MLSVVTPNYNHARYLPAALEALLAQTRPPDEIIVIDDASTDDSVAVISSFLPRHPGLRLLRNPRNIGCVPTMNRGLTEARGSIIYFAAADDTSYPQLIERGLTLLDAHPAAALFSARTDRIDAQGANLGIVPSPEPLTAPGFLSPAAAARALMSEDSWFAGNTTLYRRESLLALGGFPEALGSFTDGYISRVLALRHGACYSPEVLAAWRRLEDGLAWSETASLARLEALMTAAMQIMSKDQTLLPPGYAERWRGRFVYGVRRFELDEAKRRAKGAPARILARTREVMLAPWLFLRLRPWDAGTVLQRQLGRWLRAGAH